MSWTTVRGHRPVGVLYREREIGDLNADLGEVKQQCSCGEALFDPAHIASLLID